MLIAGLAPGVSLAAQAVERTDTPKRGTIRATFEPRIMGWDHVFVAGVSQPLGAPLSGDSVGAASIPVVGRLEQDVRTRMGVPGFVASLGKGLLSARAERRTLQLTAEVGLTDRLAIGVRVPVVRVLTRAQFRLDSLGASLGANPLATPIPGADTAYGRFFTEFDTTLARLDANLAAGAYGCPTSPQCTQARALSAQAHGVRDALGRAVYGAGTAEDSVAPFLPLASSDGGRGIDTSVARIQRDLATTYGVAGFTRTFLLPSAPLDAAGFGDLLADFVRGFGARALRDTPRDLRWSLGDVEVAAKYRIATGEHYAAAAQLVVRLPTGHLDSPNDLLDVPAGDRQTDIEGRLVQEVVVGRRLWLNLAVRAAQQRPGTRERRVAPAAAFLVSRQTLTRLRWDPGDYAAVDFAPLWQFTPRFAVGPTLGLWIRARDRYTFVTPQDSLDLAGRLGAPVSASVLDGATAERWVRFGAAATYVGPSFEAGFSVEQTVSAAVEGGGQPPVATVFRIVMRTSRKLF